MSLVIESVTKRFHEVVALDSVSFSVEPGRIFGLLGANGAGKTTCMRIVLDILRADAGRVTWQGVENTLLPRRTWGYLPEERGLYPRMKVNEQLRFFAALYGVSDADAKTEIDDWLERFRIPDYLDRKGGAVEGHRGERPMRCGSAYIRIYAEGPGRPGRAGMPSVRR
jgi:ABC-2 type transport system ATP-binding protein